MSETVNKKRIAKNTIMLYIRMLLSTVVSLYTSRVVLNTLGVEDFGIYGLVGGVVGMFTFLNGAMSGATSRFLTYEMGKGNLQRMKEAFISALIIHIGIALIILVLAETVGLWFMANKLVIPEERMFAAHCVYQLSILSMAVSVTQVPYNASIIAHEKMDIYAYVEILKVTLKLIIVYLLLIGNFDKLILYAILTLAVSITIAMIYRIYCVRKFEETHFQWVWKPEMLKPMLSFSGWDLYGNMSVSFNQQGIAIVLNLFRGAALNAANSIALTVQGVVAGLVYNMILAFRPQIIKNYARNDVPTALRMVNDAQKYSLCLWGMLAIPLFFEVDFVLKTWLGVVPEYASYFLKIVLIGSGMELSKNIFTILIHATGRIKKYSVMTGTFYFLIPVVMYCLMKLGVRLEIAYAVIPCMYLITLLVTMIMVKMLITEFSVRNCITYSLLPILPAYAVVSLISPMLSMCLNESWFRFVLNVIGSALIFGTYTWFVILTRQQRKKIISKIW